MRLLTVVAHSDRSFSKAQKCIKFIENIEEHHSLFGLEFSMKKWKCLHLDININQIETHVIDIYFTFVHLNRSLALFYNYCLCNYLFHSTIFTRPHKSLSCLSKGSLTAGYLLTIWEGTVTALVTYTIQHPEHTWIISSRTQKGTKPGFLTSKKYNVHHQRG